MKAINSIKKLIPLQIKRGIKLWWHRGDQFVCPLCQYAAKELLPIGLDIPILREMAVAGAGRRLGGCLKCNSTDKERLVYLFLANKANIFSTKQVRILHIAPEKNLSQKLYETGFTQYVCGDLFTESYQYPTYVQPMNVLQLPFEKDWFDFVICNHVLEHVPEDRAAMRELSRVLKPGGQAIVQVPIAKKLAHTVEDASITTPQAREQAFGQFDHVRLYGMDYADRLQQCGFTVSKFNLFLEFPQYGLNENEDIYIGSK